MCVIYVTCDICIKLSLVFPDLSHRRTRSGLRIDVLAENLQECIQQSYRHRSTSTTSTLSSYYSDDDYNYYGVDSGPGIDDHDVYPVILPALVVVVNPANPPRETTFASALETSQRNLHRRGYENLDQFADSLIPISHNPQIVSIVEGISGVPVESLEPFVPPISSAAEVVPPTSAAEVVPPTSAAEDHDQLFVPRPLIVAAAMPLGDFVALAREELVRRTSPMYRRAVRALYKAKNKDESKK